MPPPLALVRAVDSLRLGLASAARRLLPPQFALMDVVTSKWRGFALETITRLGVAESIGRGTKAIEAIAADTGVDVDALYRVLRALARDGLLQESPGRRFALTALTRPLLADAPDSMRNAVLMMGSKHQNALWPRLETAVRTGRPVFRDAFGKDFWDYLRDEPAEGAVFHAAMGEYTRDAASHVAAACDFGRFARVADLGGGEGMLLAALLAAYPALRGVNFDLAESMARAPETLARRGVAARCEIRAGDMFRDVPRDVDAFLLKNIVHSLDDADAVALLRRCREALPARGALFLVEMVVPEESGPYLAFIDLVMLMGNGGKERTRAEFAAIAREAGFTLVAVHGTVTPMAVIECAPA